MSEVQPEHSRRHLLANLFAVAGYLVLLPITAFTIVRILGLDDSQPVVLAQTFTPFIFLPVYLVLLAVIALFAVFAHRRVLLVMSVVLVICHVVFVFPEFRPATSLPDRVATAPKLTVFSQNVKYDNPTPALVADTIEDKDADIVLIQELTSRTEGLLRERGVFEAYQYTTLQPRRGAQGLGIWSKYPLRDVQLVSEFDMPAIRAVADVDGRSVVIWNIHTQSPPIEEGSMRGWQNDLRETRENLHAETGDVVAAGDFNSVYSHRLYREIVSNGYRDVHIDRGRGHARTWPVDSPRWARWGGVIRIDHMLTHGSVRAISIEETAGLGSDHRGMYSEMALL